MPANLTPAYRAAEKAYREARSPAEKLVCLEEMLRIIPKHKGTDHLQADLKKRISKLRAEIEGGGSGKKKGTSHAVRHEGAGQIVLVGPPNAGKSALLGALTHAEPAVAPYPFTTQHPEPGMMPVDDVQVQLVDLPPVSPEHTEIFVFDCVRAADAMALVLGLDDPEPDTEFSTTLELLEQRYLQPVPAAGRVDAHLAEPTSDFRIKRLPAVLVLSRLDTAGAEMVDLLQELVITDLPMQPVSVETGEGLDELRRTLLALLNVIRIYTKEPHKEPDMEAPFTLPAGSTVMDLAFKIHKQIAHNLKSARAWGSTKFPGQTVHADFVLHDRDVVELHY